MTRLTLRHEQILALFADGFDTDEVGARLHLSPNTVKTYVKQLYERLGALNRAHAVAIGFRQGLLS